MLNPWRLAGTPLPSQCRVCGAWPSAVLCPDCRSRFAAPIDRCPGCALPLPPGAHRCGECIAPATPSPLDACVAAVTYGYPWDALLARFKFRNEPGWARLLANLMREAPGAQALLTSDRLLVPIPLTSQRQAERGFNQAWELVKALRALHAGPAGVDALVRLREVPAQHRLSREQRLRNLRGVFAAHPHHVGRLTGAHVLLVDDVSTTGATLQAAALALRQAGAASVSALVFARTAPL